MATTVNNISNQHLSYLVGTPIDGTSFGCCWIALAPGQSTGLSSPNYTIGAVPVSPVPRNATNPTSAQTNPNSARTNPESTSTSGGTRVLNYGPTALVFKSLGKDDIVIKPGESTTLTGGEHDVDILAKA